ncbi:peptidoglycan-binding domain-containing protein [Actinomadura nitritigenes]|uniref:peptidoglycan-binding domain-containing protein n=1 Tax=Actinomadura nitritigenes TaxID=134602 RepID=UPI003D90B351
MTQQTAPVKAPPFPGRNLEQPPPMKGADVRTWQAQMGNRGWTITVDGVYGPDSESICREFQQRKNLQVDGIVGSITWKAAWEAPID